MTALAEHVQHTWLCDTHEHLRTERVYLEQGPDVLVDLFGNYLSADLISAGASQEAVAALLDSGNADVEAALAGRARGLAALPLHGLRRGGARRRARGLRYGRDHAGRH